MIAALLVGACGGDGAGDGVDASTSNMPDAGVVRPDGRVTMPDAKVTTPDAPTQPPGLRVFVSSLRYPADLKTAGGKATGKASADAICQTLADAAGLGGTYVAWLSTSDQNAIDHVQGPGPWYRVDGALAF